MKQKKLPRILFLWIAFTSTLFAFSQQRGDIAFTALNTDGNQDFGIVALADIAAGSNIYFTDAAWNENNDSFTITATDGFLTWDTGNELIKSGQVIIFTDINNAYNTNFSASIGSLSREGSFSIDKAGETIFAYIGSDMLAPSLFLTGIKNGKLSSTAPLNISELKGTGMGLLGFDLIKGTNFLELNTNDVIHGSFFSASRSHASTILLPTTSYAIHFTKLVNSLNWTSTNENGEELLPLSIEAFTTNLTIWIGFTSNWGTPSNWTFGVPTCNSSVNILPSLTINPLNPPMIETNDAAEVGNITISSADGLSIFGGNLSVSGNLTINAGSKLSLTSLMPATNTIDAATLIVNGSYTAATEDQFLYFAETYFDDTSGWSLISSPTVGENIYDFTNFNNIQRSPTKPDYFGIAPYITVY
jgi:hypothetical protein